MENRESAERLREVNRQYLIFLIGFPLVLVVLSIVFNYMWLTGYAEQNANFIHRNAVNGNMREVGLAINEAHLKYFTAIEFKSSRPGASFVFPPIAAYKTAPFYDEILNGKIEVTTHKDGDTEHITFSYNRFRLLPYAIAFWLAFNVLILLPLHLLKKKLSLIHGQQIAVAKDVAHSQLAKKVSHDIKGPLSALMVLSENKSFSSKNVSDLFQSIIEHIQKIANELDPNMIVNVTPLETLKDDVFKAVQETRIRTPTDVQIVTKLDDIAARVFYVPYEVQSILSNLINNSVEAGANRLKISLREVTDIVEVLVEDNGKGMSPDILAKVTEKGFSHGKARGSGIGLYNAANNIRNWGGEISIASEEGVGTAIKIHFPIVSRPSWYVESINLSNDDTVVIIDDQVAIHRMWEIKLKQSSFCGKVETFFTVADAKSFLSDSGTSNVHIFADYDLGDGEPVGLTIFGATSGYKTGALVTGQADSDEIKTACSQHRIGLISKQALVSIPIFVV